MRAEAERETTVAVDSNDGADMAGKRVADFGAVLGIG